MVYSSSDGSPRRRRTSRTRLIHRVMELSPAVRRAFDVRPMAAERAAWLSLTGHQLEALTALHEGSLTMGALCDRLDISESAGTALSDRLVARGMVARETDPADRRVIKLALTDEARAMVERYREIKHARAAELLSALDRDDLERLVRIYETLLSASGTATAPPGAATSPAAPAEPAHLASRSAHRRSAGTATATKVPATANRP
jgi:DNA-binding MarR family transcriptional regulator